MKSYENVLIFTPTLTEDEVRNMVSKHRNDLQAVGAEIVHEDFWGLRQMEYPINKKTTGIYLVTEYQAKDDAVAKMEVLYKRNESILRFMTIALDKHAVIYNDKKRNGLIGRNRKTEASEEPQKQEEA
jgi:small subunit ribosomal protein S6